MFPKLPSWGALEPVLAGIFARRYFANNGPLVRALDAALAERFGVAAAVCVTNEMLAATVAASALEPGGEVVLAALSPPSLVAGLRWAGMRPVFCDVEPGESGPSAATVRAHVSERTAAIAVDDWCAGTAHVDELAEFAGERGIPLLIAAWRGLAPLRALSQPGAVGLVSFGEDALLTAGEGGAILTADEALAAKLRTIRNFHPSETFAPVRLRINAKMSEAQAAFVLVGLEGLGTTIAAQAARARAYAAALAGIPHVRLCTGDPGDDGPLALVFDDDGRSERVEAALAAADIVCERPVALAPGFGACDALARRFLTLPQAYAASHSGAADICRLISGALA